MTELSVELLGGEVAIAAADRRGQVFVGVFGVSQQALQTLGQPYGSVEDALLVAGGERGQVGRRQCRTGSIVDDQVRLLCDIADHLEPPLDRRNFFSRLFGGTGDGLAGVGVIVQNQRGVLGRGVRRLGGITAEGQ